MGNPEDYLDDRVKMVRLNLKKVSLDLPTQLEKESWNSRKSHLVLGEVNDGVQVEEEGEKVGDQDMWASSGILDLLQLRYDDDDGDNLVG